jgi:hypothetical protein
MRFVYVLLEGEKVAKEEVVFGHSLHQVSGNACDVV